MTKVLCVTLKWGTRTDHVQILCFSKHQTNSFITFVSLLCGNEVWVDLFLNSKVILHKNSEKRVDYKEQWEKSRLSVGIVGITWWQYDWHDCFIIMRHICCNIVFLSFILNPKVLLDQQMLGFAFTCKCLVLNNLHCWSGLWQKNSELVYCSCAQGHFQWMYKSLWIWVHFNCCLKIAVLNVVLLKLLLFCRSVQQQRLPIPAHRPRK